ncbi:MAG: hypothetical protein Q8O89_01345, partial [Nanoarchaeota archaeon]|nr:hypothetical protein [Nanoarchaeota archaeon]
AAVLGAESDFKTSAESPVGAYGLGQMTSIGFKELNRQMDETSRMVRFYDSIAVLDKNQQKKFSNLKEKLSTLKILVGDNASQDKYKINPDYQVQVSMAYFDLLLDQFSRYSKELGKGFNPIEAAASAYNCGPTATKRLIEQYGVNWNDHKLAETETHWNRIVAYGKKIESIQSKLEQFGNIENVSISKNIADSERANEYQIARMD